jgi:hypothetical protein
MSEYYVMNRWATAGVLQGVGVAGDPKAVTPVLGDSQ